MDIISEAEAKRLAQKFVGAGAELTECDEPPHGYGNSFPPDEAFYYFSVYRPFDRPHVGGDEIVSVDRRTGEVRHEGIIGE